MMDQDIFHIEFDNRRYPEAQFDMLSLQQVFSRAHDHDPRDLHRVGFFMLILVTDGQGQHTIDFRTHPFRKGDLLTIREDQVHRFHDHEAKGWLLLFTPNFLVSYLEKQEAMKTLTLFNEMLGSPLLHLSKQELADLELLVDQISEEYQGIKDSYSLGIIRSLLHILISKLYRSKSGRGLMIANRKYLSEFLKLQSLVEQHCFKTRKVGDYADWMALSSKTLNHVTRHVLDKSTKTFIDEVTILQVKRLLVNTRLGIKEIAFQAGFEDPTNFFKFFKKYTQNTPEEFRGGYGVL
ncbi:MAG: helix-turn-helix transcriptional regulator [Bacteroidota bacterium]